MGLVALGTMAGFRVMGSAVGQKVRQQAACVVDLACAGASPVDSAEATMVRHPAAPDIGEPKFDEIGGGMDASYTPFDGSVFVTPDGETPVHTNDVAQGAIADCYLVAAVAAVARANPEMLQYAIRDNGDGTFTVTFRERPPPGRFWDQRYDEVEIRVNNEFPSVDGIPVFARPGDDDREMWPMIIEKAYAEWKGSYNKIGKGGDAAEVMEALTGQPGISHGVDSETGQWNMAFETLADALDAGAAVTSGTRSDGNGRLFQDGTLVGWHAYHVVGADRMTRTVILRNPFGWDAGETRISWADYQQHFTSMHANPARTPRLLDGVLVPYRFP